MSRPIHKLAARTVDTAGPGRYSDGGGLYLRVTATGARRWVFRYTDPTTGAVRETGLGTAGKTGVLLADARKAATELRGMVRDGANPHHRSEDSPAARFVPTFGEFADDFVRSQAAGFRNAKHAAQWESTLASYGEPLRKLPIDAIDTDHVLAVLKPIWLTKAETASRVRGRIERVLDAAKALGFRSGENPARWRGHLSLLLPKQPKFSRGHHAALPYADLPAFMKALAQRPGTAARALEFAILTAARSGEVRMMTWAEIDPDALLWTVPANRMKAGRAHRVPLTPHTLELLRKAGTDETKQGYIFVGSRDARPLTDAAVSAVLKRMNLSVTVHGFRSTFRDWVGDQTDVPREVAEAALAHVIGDASEQAYRRGDALQRRAQLMQKWHTYCLSGEAGARERAVDWRETALVVGR
jgi:integrase